MSFSSSLHFGFNGPYSPQGNDPMAEKDKPDAGGSEGEKAHEPFPVFPENIRGRH